METEVEGKKTWLSQNRNILHHTCEISAVSINTNIQLKANKKISQEMSYLSKRIVKIHVHCFLFCLFFYIIVEEIFVTNVRMYVKPLLELWLNIQNIFIIHKMQNKTKTGLIFSFYDLQAE